MDLQTQLALSGIVSVILAIAGAIIGCFVTYFIIRMGVFHGLRAHTRWVDNGKDYERIR